MSIDYHNLIDNAGIVAASLTAIYGINAWRRELRGKKEHDLAEEVLSLVYECRDRMRAIRSPMSSTQEGKTRQAKPDEQPEESATFNRAYVAFERYQANQEAFNKLFSLRYRFMALFGTNRAQPIEDIRLALNKIFISAQMLPSYWMRQGRQFRKDDDFQQHLDEMHRHEAVFWGTFSDNDEFDKSVNLIVERMDVICAEILRPPPLMMRLKTRFKKIINP